MFWQDKTLIDAGSAAIVAEGLFASTPVATDEGWVKAGRLVAGDYVLTFDGGPREILSLTLQTLSPTVPTAAWPLSVPKGVFGNAKDVLVLPEQGVMLESDLAEDLYGEPFVTMPAHALEGWHGIARVRPPQETVVQLVFERADLIFAGRDMLLTCPGLPQLSASLGVESCTALPLGPAAARHLILCMIQQEATEGPRLRLVPQD